MPVLITDLFDYDTKAIIDFAVHSSGLKDGTVDHAVRVPAGRPVDGDASIYLKTAQFKDGITDISILERLHPAVAADIATALRDAVATAREDVRLEEIVHASITGFTATAAERVRKSATAIARIRVRFAVAKMNIERYSKKRMDDLKKDFGLDTPGDTES